MPDYKTHKCNIQFSPVRLPRYARISVKVTEWNEWIKLNGSYFTFSLKQSLRDKAKVEVFATDGKWPVLHRLTL